MSKKIILGSPNCKCSKNVNVKKKIHKKIRLVVLNIFVETETFLSGFFEYKV